MKAMFLSAAALLALLAATAPGLAAPATAPSDTARYAFEPAGDGFARLDKVTGDVSYCRMEQIDLVCRAAIDDRKDYERQIAELGRENAQLKAQLGAPGASAFAEPKKQKPALEQKKAEAGDQIDLATYIVERMIHAMRDIESDIGEPPPAQPPKTYSE